MSLRVEGVTPERSNPQDETDGYSGVDFGPSLALRTYVAFSGFSQHWRVARYEERRLCMMVWVKKNKAATKGGLSHRQQASL